MSWLTQFVTENVRQQLPAGPDGSAEIVRYRRRDAGVEAARIPSTSSLTLVNVGLMLVNVAVFVLLAIKLP